MEVEPLKLDGQEGAFGGRVGQKGRGGSVGVKCGVEMEVENVENLIKRLYSAVVQEWQVSGKLGGWSYKWEVIEAMTSMGWNWLVLGCTRAAGKQLVKCVVTYEVVLYLIYKYILFQAQQSLLNIFNHGEVESSTHTESISTLLSSTQNIL